MGEFLIFIFFVRVILFKKFKMYLGKYDEGVNNFIYKCYVSILFELFLLFKWIYKFYKN